MERANKRLKYELGEGNYTIIEKQDTRQIVAYNYRNRVIYLEITDNHPFHIPRFINMWNHDRYANLPMYIYKYIGMCGENPCPSQCLWCRMFDYWSPATRIPDVCDRFVRVDAFISNSVKMEFVFQNKRNLPEDLVPTIFSYLQEGTYGSLPLTAP